MTEPSVSSHSVPFTVLTEHRVKDILLVYWMLQYNHWIRPGEILDSEIRIENHEIMIHGMKWDEQKVKVVHDIWCPLDRTQFEHMQREKLIKKAPSPPYPNETWHLSEKGDKEAERNIRDLLLKLPHILNRENMPMYPDVEQRYYLSGVVEKALARGYSLMEMLLLQS